MALLLVITLPLYSLVFLFGGAVPQEVLSVLVFQLFTTGLIAAFSVIWSTLALRSSWSTVLSYATVTWMVLVTGLVGYGLKFAATHFPMDYFLNSWGGILLDLNPLWIEASLENAVTTSPYSWVVFVLVYGVIALLLAIPCAWRLRPQSMRFLPRTMRSDGKSYQ
jgi:hypothetical protein